jgi:cytochrome P450
VKSPQSQCLGQNLANAESRLIMAKILYKYNMELDAEKTPADWLDQKSWAVFVKKHMHVRFSVAAK